MNELFIWAVKNKVRFPYKGMIGTEDLYDLSVTELDKVFKSLNASFKQAKEESLLASKTKEDEKIEKQIEIVKFIVADKLEEKKAREQAAVNKAKNQRIMEIIANKKDEALQNLSVEELEKLLV